MAAGKPTDSVRVSNFLSKALLAIALDKKAREALKQSRKGAEKAAKAPTAKPVAKAAVPVAKPKPPAPAAVQKSPVAAIPAAAAADPLTERLDKADKSDRRALIRNAIKVRREKMTVLADLSEEQRRGLQLAALQAIIERSKGGGKGS